MNEVRINRVLPGQVAELQTISRSTFIETFADVNTPENMNKYLEDNLTTEQLSGELNNEQSQFYFAVTDGQVSGYLKLNFGQAQTEPQGDNSLEIERIYVLQAYHGQKVGQALYEHAVQVAVEAGAPYIWLGVWEKNARAIKFYAKNGFSEFSQHIFRLGNDVQTDILMKKALTR